VENYFVSQIYFIMKNFKILSALILCVVCFITACTTTTPNPSNTTPAAGTWKITSFIDDSKDETSDYNGYTFDFDSNGVLKAKKDSQNWSGTWQTGVDDSANKLVMAFNSGNSVLSELEEDWRIIEMSDTFIHLEHVSGGNGGTDVVKFSKI
jgi:hypothetical protein